MHIGSVDRWLAEKGEPFLSAAVLLAGLAMVAIALKGPEWLKALVLGILIV